MSTATSIQLAPKFAAHMSSTLMHSASGNAALVAKLKETYGLSALKVAALDETEVARTVAMLDFLSNNLPASSLNSWLHRMI